MFISRFHRVTNFYFLLVIVAVVTAVSCCLHPKHLYKDIIDAHSLKMLAFDHLYRMYFNSTAWLISFVVRLFLPHYKTSHFFSYLNFIRMLDLCNNAVVKKGLFYKKWWWKFHATLPRSSTFLHSLLTANPELSCHNHSQDYAFNSHVKTFTLCGWLAAVNRRMVLSCKFWLIWFRRKGPGASWYRCYHCR